MTNAKQSSTTRRLIAWPVLFLFVVLAQSFSARCKEWKSDELNCAVTVPDSWKEGSVPERHVKVLFQNADSTKVVFLMVTTDPKLAVLNDEFVKGMKEGLQSQGGKVVRERRFEISGLPACEVVAEFSANGRRASCKMRAVVANHVAYAMQGMSANGNAENDPDVEQFLESFRFLSAPEKVVADVNTVAFRIGYLVGRWGVLIGVFLSVMAVAVIFIVRTIAANRSKPPPQ